MEGSKDLKASCRPSLYFLQSLPPNTHTTGHACVLYLIFVWVFIFRLAGDFFFVVVIVAQSHVSYQESPRSAALVTGVFLLLMWSLQKTLMSAWIVLCPHCLPSVKQWKKNKRYPQRLEELRSLWSNKTNSLREVSMTWYPASKAVCHLRCSSQAR